MRAMVRTRSRLNIYFVYVNGEYVENVSAVNSRSAVMVYCRSNGIGIIQSYSLGQCGYRSSYCYKMSNGFRPCGLRSLCVPNYVAMTGIGAITVMPSPTGGIGG